MRWQSLDAIVGTKMLLPTASDINPHGDLDGNAAEEHFLGKSHAEALLLFKENSIYYLEDLMWMGSKAYCFYVHAAIEYVKSEEALGNSDMVNCLIGTFAFRLEHDRHEVEQVLGEMKEVTNYLLANWDQYDVDQEIYSDLRTQCEELLESL